MAPLRGRPLTQFDDFQQTVESLALAAETPLISTPLLEVYQEDVTQENTWDHET